MPKGIIQLNSSYVGVVRLIQQTHWSWDNSDLLFSIVPTFVAVGISLVLFLPLALGTKVLQEPRLNPFEMFIVNLETYHPTIVLATKSIWMSMAENIKGDSGKLSVLKHVFTVGEPITVLENDVINQFLKKLGYQVILENMYGMSECNATNTYHTTECHNAISAGIQMPFTSITFYNPDTQKECKYMEHGILVYRVPTMMKSYLNRPQATDDFFLMDDKGNQWAVSNDIGYMQPNGEIIICCRAKERYTNEEGKSIYPFFIDQVVATNPRVLRCKTLTTVHHGKKC